MMDGDSRLLSMGIWLLCLTELPNLDQEVLSSKVSNSKMVANMKLKIMHLKYSIQLGPALLECLEVASTNAKLIVLTFKTSTMHKSKRMCFTKVESSM